MARRPQAPLEDRPTTKRIGALKGLSPFVAPYKGTALAALVPWAEDGIRQMLRW